MSEQANTIILEHHKSTLQFCYFQLGLAASAIAFAVHETEGHPLRTTPVLIGAAVLCWALSFFVGCFGIEAYQRSLRTNAEFLRLKQEASGYVLNAELMESMEKARTRVGTEAERPHRRYRAQLWLLFVGAVAYVGGHVIEMAAIPVPEVKPAAAFKGSGK